MELTPSQKTVLTALINLYRQTRDTVRGEDIAEQIDRKPGTVRNQMQGLKSLQLVEGVPGPKGGYKPTSGAYEILNVDRIDNSADVSLTHNDEVVEDVNIEAIHLSNVLHPSLCRVKINIQGSIRGFQAGDEIRIGPTPVTRLQITGRIDAKDETNSTLFLFVEEMLAPAGERKQNETN